MDEGLGPCSRVKDRVGGKRTVEEGLGPYRRVEYRRVDSRTV